MTSNHSNVSGIHSASPGGRGRGRSFTSRGRGRGGRGRGSFSRGQQHHASSGYIFTRSGFPGQSSSGIGSAPTVPYISPSVSAPSSSIGVLPPPPSPTVCQICGNPGHSGLRCNNRFNHAFVANDLPKSFAAMSIGETNDATWNLDSAAFAHMTPSEGQSLRSNSPSSFQ